MDKALLEKLALEVQKLVTSGVPIRTAIAKVWKKYNMPNVFLSAVYKSVEATVLKELGVANIGGASKARDAWSKMVNGKEVKAQIAKASARARLDLEQEIRGVIKSGDGVKDAAVKLQEKAKGSTATVRREIREIAKFGATPKQLATLNKALKSELKTPELRASYQEVIKAVQKGLPEKIEKAVKHAVIDKTRYNMQRVVTTEQARAHFATQREKIAEDKDVKFVKFVLASGHKPDECDAYANADMGYGKGIYPLDQAPVLPIHPNGRSILRPVYVAKKTGKEVSPEKALESYADKNDLKFGNEGIKLAPIVSKLK